VETPKSDRSVVLFFLKQILDVIRILRSTSLLESLLLIRLLVPTVIPTAVPVLPKVSYRLRRTARDSVSSQGALLAPG
jgi:hypothetical protein